MNLSTSTRLTLVAVLAILTCMPAAGWLIAQAYERSAQASFDSRLEAYADALAGALEVTPGGEIGMAGNPRDLRFEQVFSGWYWQLHRGGAVIATSRSLWDSSLLAPPTAAGEAVLRRLDLRGPRDEPLRGVALQLQLGRVEGPVQLLVTLPTSELDLEVAAFRRLLVVALGSLALMLVLVFALQIRWGLKPLRRLEQNLRHVRSGASSQVEPDLPGDLQQVALVMNEVLDHQQKLIDRARSTAGNLAHALKTPLATLRLGIDQEPQDASTLHAALDQVQGIVEHHLARAAAAGRAAGIYHRTRLQEAAGPVLEAVRGLHRERRVELDVRFDADTEVLVDAQDLQELIGNLLDNAMKWAHRRVQLRTTTGEANVRLQVDDDGPGIPPEARAQVLARGTQLDEGSQGSGLGLAIVRDIAALYRIGFGLEQSPDGGLRAWLELPRSPSARD